MIKKFVKTLLLSFMMVAGLEVGNGMTFAQAANLVDHDVRQIASGQKYAFVKSKPSAPLVVVLGITKENSLDPSLTPIIQNLRGAGFNLVTIDAPCHGDDAESYAPINGLVCWPNRIKRDGNFALKFGKTVSKVIDDVRDHGMADTRSVSVVGISRGAYIGAWSALSDARINNIVALAPVTELMALAEFKGFNKGKSVTNFDGHYKDLSKKSIFLQVSNFDDRISTSAALHFVAEIGASQPVNSQVDLTAVITPKRGHADAEYEEATQWLLHRTARK